MSNTSWYQLNYKGKLWTFCIYDSHLIQSSTQRETCTEWYRFTGKWPCKNFGGDSSLSVAAGIWPPQYHWTAHVSLRMFSHDNHITIEPKPKILVINSNRKNKLSIILKWSIHLFICCIQCSQSSLTKAFYVFEILKVIHICLNHIRN